MRTFQAKPHYKVTTLLGDMILTVQDHRTLYFQFNNVLIRGVKYRGHFTMVRYLDGWGPKREDESKPSAGHNIFHALWMYQAGAVGKDISEVTRIKFITEMLAWGEAWADRTSEAFQKVRKVKLNNEIARVQYDIARAEEKLAQLKEKLHQLECAEENPEAITK